MSLALITGGSSGIGLELARRFAEHGDDLMIAADDSGIHAAAPATVASVKKDLQEVKGARHGRT